MPNTSTFRSRGGQWLIGQGLLFALYGWVLFRPFHRATHVLDAGWLLPFLGVLFMLIGILMGISAFWTLGKSLTAFPVPLEHGRLVSHGVYTWVRHPIYGSIILSGLGVALWVQNPEAALVVGMLLVFFRMKSASEEVFLEQKYPDYAAYRLKTPHRMIPLLW
ncbi:MAG: isoprenylcysteine carboxylmethyltransferase family protein [Bacteroidetes Order II. Incertae sedis bacterium]|nr:isoprenylcysteine carboxylmethyltransferase family protein [Bacteroidetes Order II. bacterium]